MQILYTILMGVCFIGMSAGSDSVSSIVEPKIGMVGDEVTITAVNGACLFSSAQALLFIHEEGEVVERVPVTVVSSTTVYASISKLDIEPGTYTLALDIGAEELLLLDASFFVQPPEGEKIEQKNPLIEVTVLEPIEPIIDETEEKSKKDVKEPLIVVTILEPILPGSNQAEVSYGPRLEDNI